MLFVKVSDYRALTKERGRETKKKKSQYTFPRAEKKRETIGIGGLIHSLLDRCALGWDFIMQRSLQQMNIYSTFRGSALDAF